LLGQAGFGWAALEWGKGSGCWAGLGFQPGFSAQYRIGMRKILFFFKFFYNLQTNLNSIQI
jgi:hypothetical protein